MLYPVIKALISGAIIAAVSEVAKRSPGFGALVASLPFVSVLGMMWLWRDTHDPARMASHAGATFWFVANVSAYPRPANARRAVLATLGAGCLLTIALYLMMT